MTLAPALPHATTRAADGCSAWNPGVGTGIPREFRALETIVRPECVSVGLEEIQELAGMTGLPPEELTEFRPSRLALHELILRVTADIAVAEGDTEEVFGRNFRRIAATIRDGYVAARMEAIERAHAELRQRAGILVRRILEQTLFRPTADAPPARSLPFRLFRKPASLPPAEPTADREHRVVTGFRAAGDSAADPLERAAYKSLHRVLGAIAGRRGSVGSDLELLAKLVTRHVCNGYGSRVVGAEVGPAVDAAIEREGYTRIPTRESPVLISLKGASAAGKSSLRPMVKRLMRDNGIEPDGYATISPDVWRRLLLDYDSLGPAYKYAGHLTSRELMAIDAKLDRYIRSRADRARAIPHLLVDRFRFDSFSSEQVHRVLHETYARYVSTMYMYFVITPPEETVERGWQRALERGRYKAVEDFLGHCVEAYAGMPRILFRWLSYPHFDYRYWFLDNRVPKGTFPTTIAFGNRDQMTICDPAALIDIQRYQKIDIHAGSREEVYPPGLATDVAGNAGFLKECIRQIAVVTLVDGAGGAAYLRAHGGHFEVLDQAALEKAISDARTAEAIREIAPQYAGRHSG